MKKLLYWALSASAGCIAPGVAFSQAGADLQPDNAVQTITVTARRREERLENVPVSVSVLTGEALTKQGITTEADLQSAAPGLVVRTSEGGSAFNFAIRGQSIDAFSSAQPGILAYFNEFQNTTTSPSSLYDLASVQVLKGPQGTLFGRNTTGGAVLYTSAQPTTNALSGSLMARYGTFNSRQAQGMLNLPLSDTLAIRFAGNLDVRSGYIRNLVTGEDLNSRNRQSGRVSLAWTPGNLFRTVTVAEFGRSHDNGTPMVAFSGYAPGQIGPPPANIPLASTMAAFYSQVLDTITAPGAFQALRNAYPLLPPGGYLDFIKWQRSQGGRVVALDAPLGNHTHSKVLVNTSTVALSAAATIKNIVGYASSHTLSDNDQDGSPFPGWVFTQVPHDGWSFSDELQLSGEVLDNKLNYVGGLYYSRERKTDGEFVRVFELGPIADPILGLPFQAHYLSSILDTTTGVYFQGTYQLAALLEGLSITGGGRYTWEKIDAAYVGDAFTPPFPFGTLEKRKDNKPSWQLGLEYHPVADALLYATWRGSWRSGGFNKDAPPIRALAENGGNMFIPETIQDVEIGAKFSGHVGGMPLRANAALFKEWVDKAQRSAYVSLPGFGLAALTYNVPGGVQYKGAELEVEASPAPWLRFGVNGAWISGDYGSPHAANLFGTNIDFTTIADLVRFSGNVFAELHTGIGTRGDNVSFRTDVYKQTSMYFSNSGNSNSPDTLLPGYTLVNLRLDWHDILGSAYSAAVLARNVGNKFYYTGGLAQGSQAGVNTSVFGEPRTIMLELSYKF